MTNGKGGVEIGTRSQQDAGRGKATVEENPEARALVAIRALPADFTRCVLGKEPTGYQAAIMASVRDHRRTLVVSCNCIGKDFIAGCITLWWLQCWEEAAVITIAPTGHQVRHVQWREIRALHAGTRVPLGGELLRVEPEYRLGPKRFALGLSTTEKERLQGIHNRHLLVIITEGTGVTDEIYDAVRTLMAGGDARLLVLTNPTRSEGWCYDACHGQREGWNVIEVSAFDTPNLQHCSALGPHQVPDECPRSFPFLITHEWAEEVARDFGEDSDYYRVHVLGQWPHASEDAVIPLEWIEAAMQRQAERSDAMRGGLDVARLGNDRTALAIGAGDRLVSLQEWSGQEVTETEGKCRQALERFPGLVLAIDDTGLGGGVAPRLSADHRTRILAVTFGGRAESAEHYADKMTELWMRLAYAIRDELDLSALKQHELGRRVIAQLTRARKRVCPDGRIKVDKRGEGTESPDLGDALALWNEARIQGRRRGTVMWV